MRSLRSVTGQALAGSVLVFAFASIVAGCSESSEDLASYTVPNYSASEDTEFAEAVLADGIVTREEMEQRFSKVFACFVEEGLDGTVWHNLDGTTTFYYTTTDAPEPTASDPDPVGRIVDQCQAKYSRIRTAYDKGIDQQALDMAGFQLAMQCLKEREPDIASRVPQDITGLEDLTSWYSDSGLLGSGGVSWECIAEFGEPEVPMSDYAQQ